MTTQLDFARVPFAADLSSYGHRPAIIADGRTVTYLELGQRVGDLARDLGGERRLIALAASNDVDSLVAYLAALTGGHPLILLPEDKPAALGSLIAAYDPDVVLRSAHGEFSLEERRAGSRHDLHPDLALLLSTSGSTGSPKLVRLSHANLQANAESIATYLGITPEDRAVTTLPVSYCYGLSVINSHLLRGATLVLTGLSVVDPCFWDLCRSERVTSFAAVPYTFELLDRVGFSGVELPSLRYVTQAGGRLAPERVRHFAELGKNRGWDLFVMYGQTEATARMAYLPPRLAVDNAGAIGVPVPGGSFRIDPVEGLPDGELVYTGPNVMLGYANQPEDLALGRTLTELRTGDLARKNAAGLYEIAGRRSRFVKIVGLRVDLGQVEQLLSAIGVTAAAMGDDDMLTVAIEGGHDTNLLTKVLAQGVGLPRAAVGLHTVQELPRLGNGKINYPAVAALVRQRQAEQGTPDPGASPSGAAGQDSVRRIFQECLELTEISDTDTFVSLGGDSLSFVAVSVRLEQLLGHLPPDWHLRTVGALERTPEHRHPSEKEPGRIQKKRLLARMDTGVVLRAMGIVLIVSTHIGLLEWQGMAHVLIAAAGFNFARFQLTGRRLPRLRRQLTSVARIAVPSMAFITFAYLVTDRYSLANVVLLNAILGPEQVTTQWHFWFIEDIVYILLAMSALLAVPWLGRAERRFPLMYPLALFSAGLLTRYELIEPNVPHTLPALWLFALGWAIARARNLPQRVLVSALTVLTIPGFFDNHNRELTMIAGILLLTWLPVLPVPRILSKPVVLLASASMHIYLVHWLVYPPLVETSPALAVAASLTAGIAYWSLCNAVSYTRRRRGRKAEIRQATILPSPATTD
ncbi:AMP-binding protein [Pseudarthrobacter sp902506025]|uniref:Acyl-CoA synthetase (AMP-forming)/AMP-acid ligase II/acyl carrier protein n=1 Tax=Pseudarthrobacter defluvii TaxID=410837 RepID=A0ABT9UGA7_9MICC|nr:AMP-binding protein [Pseudarthrobacter defluvii]MDQ0118686.1 acyl-CoA synthetase (AMP-forming)/AMP-acid ligase II/acyl carrier protein [Pseudarthrobacter defluvii]